MSKTEELMGGIIINTLNITSQLEGELKAVQAQVQRLTQEKKALEDELRPYKADPKNKK